jgi:hypothetical protein
MGMLRSFAAMLALAALCPAQDYKGPRPPKPDVPYLIHATNLLAIEQSEAKEEQKKDDVTYVISGTESKSKTPLSEPSFLFENGKLSADRLELYKLEVKNGRREGTLNQKKRKGPRPLRMQVTRVDRGLYRLDVSERLESGQYSITPAESNIVFCFEVY